MTEHIETIIVGAGPAGSTCGYLLQKAGKGCLIVEKSEFPREKLCGGGLTPKTHIIIDRIFDNLKYDYHRANNMEIYSEGKFYCTFHLAPEIRIIVRKEFDNLLLEQYKNLGGKVLYGRLTKIEESDGKIFLRLSDGKQLSCDRLIGADGATSSVRKYLQPKFGKGIVCLEKLVPGKPDKDIKVIFDGRFDNGYMYVFPNKNGNVIGCGHKKSSVPEFRDLLAEYHISDKEKIKGAYIPMLEKIDYPFRRNILLIGDAGGYADSMTGEGLYYAIKTGENAANSIIHNRDFRKESRSVINEVRIIRLMSITFYCKPIHRLFLWMCTKPRLQKRINSTVIRYLRWEKA